MRRTTVVLLVMALTGACAAAAYAAFAATAQNTSTFTAASTFGGMRVATGTYTGNNSDNTPITVGFQPDVVIVKANRTEVAVMRTSSMAGDVSKDLGGATALRADLIQSLTATGFVIGRDAAVNRNNVRHDWIAFRGYANQMAVGTYGGNGANRQIGTSFSPDYVMVVSAGANAAVQRSRTMGSSFRFDQTAAAANGVTSLDAAGFSLGTSAEVNANGTNYHYVAWNAVHGLMREGSYSGDGSDYRSITGATFQPEYVIVRSSANGTVCDRGVHRPASLAGDSSLEFAALANAADLVQALEPDGFQVGTDCKVNTNLTPYYWMAFRNAS